MRIEKVGVSSVACVFGGIFAVLGAIGGFFEGMSAMIGLSFRIGIIQGLGIGLLETIMLVVIYAVIGLIIGLIVGAICAWAFNHSSRLFGGIEITVRE